MNMTTPPLWHRLGFRNLPESIPGVGPAAIAEARKATSCQTLTAVPYDQESSHWDAPAVGSLELMTACITQQFYGEHHGLLCVSSFARDGGCVREWCGALVYAHVVIQIYLAHAHAWYTLASCTLTCKTHK
jgi:hypothetical protein